MRIALVDYGLGNRRSVEKSLERVGADVLITSSPDEVADADGVVVPGVGAFPEGMRRLRAAGLDAAIRSAAQTGTPVLGLCLGMQLLFDASDEMGGAEGLGLIGGTVHQLDARGQKLPHIGWNALTVRQPQHPLLAGLPNPLALYHVHSFVADPADPAVVLAEGRYGATFPSVVARGLVMGAQCHPEKSSRDGLHLLQNFLTVCAEQRASR